MYEAPILCLAILGLCVIRDIGRRIEKCYNLPLYLHYYTWIYLLVIFLYFRVIIGAAAHVLGHTGWLNPEETNSFVKHIIQVDGAPASDYKEWQNEASLEDYQLLRFFSLLTPLWTLGTFVICIGHTREHVRVIQEAKDMGQVRGLVDMALHDATILILALPSFYALMALDSVHRLWEVCVDQTGTEIYLQRNIYETFDERKAFLFQMYDANFMVGDVYETFALVMFGKMIMQVLMRSIAKHHSENADPIRSLLEDALTNMTLAGIRLFNITCVLQAAVFLTITEMRYHQAWPRYFSTNPKHLGLFQTPAVLSALSYFFSGAGCMSSASAIGNITEVEENFHELLKDFKPARKFWATKILVSIAFLQSVLLKFIPPFSSWSDTRNKLLYASCLCLECFILAMAHTIAWPHDEEWYEDINMQKSKSVLLEMANLKDLTPRDPRTLRLAEGTGFESSRDNAHYSVPHFAGPDNDVNLAKAADGLDNDVNLAKAADGSEAAPSVESSPAPTQRSEAATASSAGAKPRPSVSEAATASSAGAQPRPGVSVIHTV